jgi:glyoxylase-like metal-dependent hydrolase (beta-lactamase superfamily II)
MREPRPQDDGVGHALGHQHRHVHHGTGAPQVGVVDQTVTPIAFVDEGLGNSSYLVDLGDGRGLVVDPARHPARYLAEAARLGLEVAYAVETHLHADFVSGARELGLSGAQLLVPGAGGHEFPVRGVADGEEVDLGGLTLRALATPGHTPEHLAYLLLDGATPVALFSGGSLLVDAVARTDLIAPDQTEQLARSLWRSIHERVLTLPDDLPVYPTHGAGSFCSAPGGGERTTTVGRERRANPLLAAADEDAFVRQLLAGLGSYPPYFLRLREVNRRGPHLYGPAEPVLPRVRADDVARLQAAAWIIDVRPIDRFGRGHVPGSVSIALRPQFASWLGWIVPDGAPVTFVLDDDQDRSELVRQARNIGYETLLGELDGGIHAWEGSGRPLETIGLAPAERYEGTVVDVRQHNEYAAGHIPGAVSAELGAVDAAALPRGPVAVMCGHGERAMTGASLLARSGRRHVTVLTGGPDDWARHHGPLDTGT